METLVRSVGVTFGIFNAQQQGRGAVEEIGQRPDKANGAAATDGRRIPPVSRLQGRRAASKTGPVGSVIHQPTGWVCGFTLTSTPQGGLLVSTAVICRATSLGSWSGTIRQLTMAAAVGKTWLEAPRRDEASWAMIVMAGLRQVCS